MVDADNELKTLRENAEAEAMILRDQLQSLRSGKQGQSPEIRHQGLLVLNPGQRADLDAVSDPLCGTVSEDGVPDVTTGRPPTRDLRVVSPFRQETSSLWTARLSLGIEGQGPQGKDRAEAKVLRLNQ